MVENVCGRISFVIDASAKVLDALERVLPLEEWT
jgi:hypothetical protein